MRHWWNEEVTTEIYTQNGDASKSIFRYITEFPCGKELLCLLCVASGDHHGEAGEESREANFGLTHGTFTTKTFQQRSGWSELSTLRIM